MALRVKVGEVEDNTDLGPTCLCELEPVALTLSGIRTYPLALGMSQTCSLEPSHALQGGTPRISILQAKKLMLRELE